ncbi:hypothetical protein AHiyo4_42020 [Arthrobacter sp. Hiyo4]|nr:hypothetical protein AHiyo4_42020 [Arthrobacter sp. Hiyo4]
MPGCEIPDGGDRLALAVHTDVQVGQRVEAVRVAAVLADDDFRLERAHELRHHGVESPQPAGIPGARRQGNVDGAALSLRTADLVCETRPGKSVSPLSCSEMVRTRGSSQKMLSVPSPWCASTSMYATRLMPPSSSLWMASAESL